MENIRKRRKSINPTLRQQISNLKMTARLHPPDRQGDLHFQKEIKPAAYKVLKRRRAKKLDLHLDPHPQSHPHHEKDPMNNRLIPEILTPILNGGYPGSGFGHNNGK